MESIDKSIGSEFRNMDTAGFATFIEEPGVQVLDVRTPEEFEDGHLAGAMNIDIFDPDFSKLAETQLVKTRPVAVYCRSGRRSAEAAGILASLGFDVTNLEGGILAWEEEGRPVER